MANVKVLLTEDRMVRGKKWPAGMLLAELAPAVGVQPSDVDKALRTSAVRFELPPVAAAAKKDAKASGKPEA